MKVQIFLLILFLIIAHSCQLDIDIDDKRQSSKDNLIKADLEFSAFSETHGFRAALIQYADSSAVLLRPDQAPITGILSIAEYLEEMSNQNITVTWQPRGGMLSRSKDLGYTYGIYTIRYKDEEEQGTYATVWRKNKNGEWKYVLDTGNEGIQ